MFKTFGFYSFIFFRCMVTTASMFHSDIWFIILHCFRCMVTIQCFRHLVYITSLFQTFGFYSFIFFQMYGYYYFNVSDIWFIILHCFRYMVTIQCFRHLVYITSLFQTFGFYSFIFFRCMVTITSMFHTFGLYYYIVLDFGVVG